MTFNEADSGKYSTIDSYSTLDHHREIRTKGEKHDVTTISLQDLLEKHTAPREIDFLSIDTEGGEYEILSSFDFDKYRFQIIACEHNFTPAKRKNLFPPQPARLCSQVRITLKV